MGRTLEGVVVRGDGLGRRLGFPTANLDWEGEPPETGVYEVLVSGPDLKKRRAVCNVGRRPTVGGRDLRVEVHIPGFSGDLYGRRLSVEFARRLRPERKFSSVEELSSQIKRDVKEVESTMIKYDADGNRLGRVLALLVLAASALWLGRIYTGSQSYCPMVLLTGHCPFEATGR